jgi:hypothetical protein
MRSCLRPGVSRQIHPPIVADRRWDAQGRRGRSEQVRSTTSPRRRDGPIGRPDPGSGPRAA